MVLGILRETAFGERRVATTPPAVERLRKIGVEVLVEAGAGSAAGFDDDAHRSAGAAVLSRSEILDRADTLAMVRVPSDVRVPIAELDACCTAGRTVIGLAEPFGDPERLEAVAARGTNVLALELLPRITRAQSMDVLSSQATIAGHKAVLLAAVELDRMLPMLMTAAGTLVASRVLVIGAGVAGLQALATARRLGAVTSGYDIRAAAAEQVESVGARFVDLGLEAEDGEAAGGYAKAMGESFETEQRRRLGEVAAEHEIVIATAAVPGRPAPRLLDAAAVASMPRGGVVVDLAAERGGNCELSRAGERVEHEGRLVLGPVDLASSVPHHASLMYSRNVAAFVALLAEKGVPSLVEAREGRHVDPEADEVLRDTLLCRDGKVVSTRVLEARGALSSETVR